MKLDVYTLTEKIDEEVARLHLEQIGVKLTKLSDEQADYIGCIRRMVRINLIITGINRHSKTLKVFMN